MSETLARESLQIQLRVPIIQKWILVEINTGRPDSLNRNIVSQIRCNARSASIRKAEMQHVAILDDILLAFEAKLAGVARA
jgi:hypothetical protein